MKKSTLITNIWLISFIIPLVATAPGCFAEIPGDPTSSNEKNSSSSGNDEFGKLLRMAEQDGKVAILIELNLSELDKAAGLENFESFNEAKKIAYLQQRVTDALAFEDIQSLKRFNGIPFMGLQVDTQGLEVLRQLPEVLEIDEDRVLSPNLWGSIAATGTGRAWSSGHSGKGQTIAIIDSGIDRDHPALSGKIVAEACFSESLGPDGSNHSVCPSGESTQFGTGAAAPCALYGCGHGTHVAGIAAGNGGDIEGIAKDANIIAIQAGRSNSESIECWLLEQACVKFTESNIWSEGASFNL